MDQRGFEDFIWSNSQSVLVDKNFFPQVQLEVVST